MYMENLIMKFYSIITLMKLELQNLLVQIILTGIGTF